MSRSAREIWETALGELQIQVSKSNYRTWLERTTGLSYKDNEFTIGVPNTFIAEYLDKNQRSLIEKTLIGLVQKPVTVVFSVDCSQQSREIKSAGRPESKGPAGTSRLNAQYTFDSFIVSNCNRLAYAAALGAAEKPGLRSYNPLFIYGGVGLGKTHLLHAMGHVAQANNRSALFMSAEQFTSEFVSAVREKKTDDFRNRFRSADMLLIDDVQFFAGKQQTEESFFHIFNELHNSDRQIAVTSNQPPGGIPQLEDRLRSRLEWGLTTSVQPPDLETRIAMLRAKVDREGINVSPDILEIIAQKIRQNIRELEGALNRVMAYARLLGAVITPELATKAMEDIATKQPSAALTPLLLLETVSNCFQIPVSDMQGPRKDRQTNQARQVAMYLLRSETGFSLSQIGKEFGGREAITVSQACKKVAAAIEQDSAFKQKIADIHCRIRQKTGIN